MATRTLLCFGDSNTHGTPPMESLGDMARFNRDLRWPGRLAKALAPNHWEIIEAGHPGRTTVHDDPIEGKECNALRALTATLESHRPLDVVLVMLGTNDFKHRFSVSALDIALSLDRLVQMIKQSGCGPGQGAPAVLLVCPPPIMEVGCFADIFAGGAIKSLDLVAHLAALATRAQVPFCNAGEWITPSPIDGIHYDADTHTRLADKLADAVRAYFDK